MIRGLLKLAFLAVVCIVIYNYFFGTAAEKDQSKRIFKGVGNVFTEVRGLVRSERDKFEAGKYDAALDKMSGVLQNLKQHANDTKDPNLQRQVAQLENRRQQLQRQIDAQPEVDSNFQKQADKVKKYGELARQMESLTNDLQGLVGRVAPEQ